MVNGSNRRQFKQTLDKFSTLFQKNESNISTHILKESSTKVSISKIKSFFKNSTKENTTRSDPTPVKHVRFIFFPETATASPNVEAFQSTQSKEKIASKRPLKSCFKTTKADSHFSVVEQQQPGKKGKIVLNKIQTFFNEKIVPVFKPFEKKENVVTELEQRLYQKSSKTFEAENQLKHTERLSSEIKSMEQQQIQRKQQFELEFNVWQPKNMEKKRQEYELNEINLHFKKIERDGQLQILRDLISQLRFLEEEVYKLQSQESVMLARQKKEAIQKCKQKRLQEHQKLEQIKQTELYAWQLNQVRKKINRQGENCDLNNCPFPANPWKVREEIKREHEDQYRSWHIRYIDLQERRSRIPRSINQNRREDISNILPHKVNQTSSYKKEQRLLLRELEEMKYRQKQEEIELQKETIDYIRAYWDTKRKQLGMAIQESEITRQLSIFGRRLGTNTINLYHKLI